MRPAQVRPRFEDYLLAWIPLSPTPRSPTLSADANALHDALGGDGEAVIIGHDWVHRRPTAPPQGAPERWSRVVGMAVPPGPAMGAAFLTNPAQLERSWYMFFFQHPLADLIVPADDMAFIDLRWHDWSPGFAAGAEIEHVKSCLRDPANLTAALGDYRATSGDGPRHPDLDAIQEAGSGELAQPTLYLHGRNDGCIGVEVAESARAMSPWATIEIVDDAGHFLQLEQPEVVTRRVLEFLAR